MEQHPLHELFGVRALLPILIEEAVSSDRRSCNRKLVGVLCREYKRCTNTSLLSMNKEPVIHLQTDSV